MQGLVQEQRSHDLRSVICLGVVFLKKRAPGILEVLFLINIPVETELQGAGWWW